ncbi:MAG TPA: aldolase/citrate lyase family protein [Acetobacteraceae bacterium]|nr:aldolase/citrate lyase family protein [Acetobacteraceae bacterium]
MRLRSLLFAPGDQPRKIGKALESAADGVILDLEDSVAPAGKAAARAQVAALLPQDRPGVVVRVNPRGSAWYLEDLAAAVVGRAAAVMLPKCAGAADLAAIDHHLEALEAARGLPPGTVRVLALVSETAASVAALAGMRSVPARVAALCFGAEDLSADLGIVPRLPDGRYPAPIAAARAATILAAAAAGVAALDTPFPDPRDPAGLAAEAAAAAADGFAGKLLIHPAQIEPANAAFTPSAERVAWARAVAGAFAADPGAGVLSLAGKMIDQPHLKLARRILEGG